MGVEFEVKNANGEISLSLEKPAMVLDAWVTAAVNDSSNRSKLSSRRNTHRWLVSGYGSLSNDLIGFRTSTHYAAVVKRPNGSVEVWSNSGSLWDDFELGVFRRSTSVTGYQDDPAKFAGGYCELQAANGRFIYNSNWPNVSDIALFSTRDLISGLDRGNSNNVRRSFPGRARSGGVDWIVPMGLPATLFWLIDDWLVVTLLWYWYRYASLMRIDRSTSSDVDIRTTFSEYWRSKQGSNSGFPFVSSTVPSEHRHKSRQVFTPEIMVFRTFGTY